MHKLAFILLMISGIVQHISAQSIPNLNKLKIVMIRHGEKPVPGDNLNCMGLNRAMLLPPVITGKFGVPDFVYVPQIAMAEQTLHSRPFQTLIPLVGKYNLKVNSQHLTRNFEEIATDLKSKTGTILLCWEHKAIPYIAQALGVKLDSLLWPDDDYDSIWIVTFVNGKAVLTKDKEGLKPSADCGF
ncbi:MAG: histidine phosphatase family protein [Mucilaginibacter sp.]|uniref:histidine phosphatase family protein n=1 Tax=Mucilaginibacter sp. TaxID=1882438 RepID=UPI003264D57A